MRYLLLLPIILLSCTKPQPSQPTQPTQVTEQEFSDSLLEYIYEMRIEHPYVVYAQALKESARFTSNIYKENHNLFGMKVPERRSTVVIGVNRGHAVYLDWKMSVIDYALFQEAYMSGLTEDEYLVRLGKIYASDTNYEKDLRKLLNAIR